MYNYEVNSLDQRDVMKGDCKNQAKQMMNYHVIAHMSDGTQMDGILVDMDDEGVTMLVPEDVDMGGEARAFGQGGFGGGFGRRFHFNRFPFFFFGFPFFRPYPYYYPYPYYPYYPYPYYY